VISTSSTGAGNAGRILIAAGDLQMSGGARISSDTATADGGDIKLDVSSVVLLENSRITTSVGTGEGRGGNIDIDPVFVILFGSVIQANAFGGPGGRIVIVTDFFFADDASVVEAVSATSTIDGVVDIDSPGSDVGGGLLTLPSDYRDAAALLAERCAARRGEVRGSLVGEGRDRPPLGPDGLVPSAYARAEPAPGGSPSLAGRGERLVPIPVRLTCET
jgi:hypothetical protein